MEKKESQQSETKIPSIGLLLKTARERKGQSLDTITNILCIRLKHLKAIEESRYEALPGKTYAIGFVKSYSEYLGLDGDEVVRLFKEEVAELKKKQEIYTLDAGSEASVPSYLTVFLALAIVIVVYIVWNNTPDFAKKDIDVIEDVPETVAVEVVETKKEAPKVKKEVKPLVEVKEVVKKEVETPKEPVVIEEETEAEIVVEDEVMEEETIITEDENVPPDNVIEDQVVRQEDLEEPSEISQIIETETPEVKVVKEENRTPQVYGEENTNSRVTLTANSDSWVHIVGSRDDGEQIIFISKLFYKNDVYHMPNRSDLMLDTGNAGGIDLVVDGFKVPSLGAVGAVKRNISLNPEALLTKVIDSELEDN